MAKIYKKKTDLENNYIQYRNISIVLFLLLLTGILLIFKTKGISIFPTIFVGFIYGYYQNKARILGSGVKGEKRFLKIFSKLPKEYTIINDLEIEYDNRKSQIDYVIVGPNGIFVVEVKNHNGKIIATDTDRYWTQHKVGRGGTPYTANVSNPIKQVQGQVYSLSNYLKDNRIFNWIEGIVFFSNPSTKVSINRTNDKVPIFSMRANGDKALFEYLKSYDGKPLTTIEQLKIVDLLNHN